MMSSTHISQFFSLPMKNARMFYDDLHNLAIRNHLKRDLAIYQVITIIEESYPEVLREIKDPPLVLYANGDLSLLSATPSLSVIGTRRPSREARQKVQLIVSPLIKEKWVIISGMAKGIDGYAHQLTLSQAGRTIAVLGGGFHHIYPREHTSLFEQISQSGLVLSEYPPDQPPARYHFPERNRIISGLSFGTLVIEAMERSGTLITVDQALDQGREVYAVPGSPLVPQTKGCHQMIQDGAKVVIESKDILDDWQSFNQKILL